MRMSMFAAGATLAAAAPAWAQQGSYYGPRWGDHMMGWGFPFMGILMFVLFAAVIVVSVLLIRYLWNVGHTREAGREGEARREALELLDKRYARGEIDREEYMRRKEDLRS